MVAKETVKEQVQGLQQPPVQGGKFVVRKAEEPAEVVDTTIPGTPAYTHDLVLVIKDEDEYKVALYGFDDSTIVNATYQVIQQRRAKLRDDIFKSNDEVELTA